MNTQLVESIYQVIQSLSDEERSLLEEKLYTNQPYPSQEEIIALAETSNVFHFLHNEPDIYTLEDGEPV
ncbi:homeobox domain-containing protein [Pleurocapsales cyanobacterium LEGE 10410]|nr:homeobox domain-containing protein [Pleurocapsales cyanobacterium LEGE 10410]